jgi:hypothetical protein
MDAELRTVAQSWDSELASLLRRGNREIGAIELEDRRAKAIAQAMAERDPDARLH